MNNGLLDYNDAVKRLKLLVKYQKEYKKDRKKRYAFLEIRKCEHRLYLSRKITIKYLLSIIAAHKSARRLYGELTDIGRKLGV